MNESIKDIKLVEYSDKYADAIAEMWNNSGDCWGGYNLSLSGETVRQEEAQSDHLFIWLAVLNDKVVGYCKLSEYREDEGALYIDLLNVLPEFHGRKIGKKLVLKAVEKTMELGIPRLDLYTWTGNTKAVPLYKKSGFFWVDRDDCTHCMNLIPSVLNNELIDPYIGEFDWYDDSTRTIRIEPDGIKHDGFESYRYHWKRKDKELEVEICRHSRGIRRMRTKDFEIIAETEKLKQVFGKSYEVRYSIKNFTDVPLDVKIKGQNNRNIIFEYHTEDRVEDEKIFQASFYIDEMQERQSKYRTYPAVCAEVTLNGKRSLIKVGVDPQYPLSFSCVGERDLYTCNQHETLYLNVKNNYGEDIAYLVQLPHADILEWGDPKIDFKLKAQERNSIPVSFKLKKAGVLHEKIRITAHFDNGTSFVYEDYLDCMFQTITGVVYGEIEKEYLIMNGKYKVSIDRDEFYNEVFLCSALGREHNWIFIFPPKVGEPYTSELFKKKPYKVAYMVCDNAIQMDAFYNIEKPARLNLIMHLKLFQNGILERWVTVKNTTNMKTAMDIYLSSALVMKLHRSVIPYEDAFVYTDCETQNFYERYAGSKIHENWLFSYGMNDTLGITWDDSYKLSFSEDVFLECTLGRIDAHAEKTTEKIKLMIGTFEHWDEFREFALGEKLKKEKLTDHLECVVNNGNPFVDSEFTVEMKEYQEKCNKYPVSVFSDEECFEPATFTYNPKKRIEPLEIKPEHSCECIHFHAKVEETTPSRTLDRVLFPKNSSTIFCEKIEENGHDVWSCNNGLITFKAAADYAPVLYSMKYRDQEWIDSDFPNPGPKSWWNPWVGGISATPAGMRLGTVMKEGYTIDFVTIEDSGGNQWKGIKISVVIHEFEKYKGLSWNQYYLLLPGVPLLCYVPETIQNTGKYLRKFHLISRYFAKADKNMKNTLVRSYNSQHERFDYYSGKEAVDLCPPTVRAIGSIFRQYMVQVWTNQYKYNNISVNNKVTCFWMNDYVDIENKERRFLTPKFLILTKKLLSQGEISDLRNITFSYKNTKG